MNASTDKSTAEIMNELINTKSQRELEKLERYTYPNPIDYFDGLLKARNLNWSRAFANADLDDSYGRSVKSGRNSFNRDMICLLALGNHLTIEETQNLLKYALLGALYAKNARDKIIIYAIAHAWNIAETNAYLDSRGQKQI